MATKPNGANTRTKLSHVAYEAFKGHLLQRTLKPGQFVTQRELVALTGVPLAPVREAVQRLAVEGLVDVIPQRGIQVTQANPKRIRDAFQLRLIIEREAARVFADIGPGAVIADLERRHREILERAGTAIDDGLLADAQQLDSELHDTLVRHLDNELVWSIHQVNTVTIRLIRLDHGLLTPTTLTDSMNEHLAIIDACRRSDVGEAGHAMELHIGSAMRRALGV